MTDNQFAMTIKNHRQMLSSTAMRLTNNTDDAQDLIQETMIKALRFFDTFDAGTNVKGWLYTIMRNTFINQYHKNARRRNIITQEEQITDAHLISSARGNQAESTFAVGDIYLALNALDKSRSVPLIRYVEGYSYQEISDQLGIPLGTVKTRIHEGRKQLRKQLQMYADTL